MIVVEQVISSAINTELSSKKDIDKAAALEIRCTEELDTTNGIRTVGRQMKSKIDRKQIVVELDL